MEINEGDKNKMYSEKILGLKEVYHRLMDEESRRIFEARIDFAFDRNSDIFIQKVRPYLHDLKSREVAKALEISNAKGIIIFGCGHDGLLTKEVLEMCGYNVDYFCDSNKNKIGRVIDGISILSVNEVIQNYKNYLIIIGSRKYLSEMLSILRRGDFPIEYILKPQYELIFGMNEMQYFDIFPAMEDEVFVDAGSYNGDTTVNFMKWCHGSYQSINIFEPLKSQYEIIKERCKREKWRNVDIYNYAVWNKEEKLHFEDIDSGSRVRNDGELVVSGKRIDDIITNRVTYIKMDVEGSELNAIEGTKNLICNYRPRLAISLYHKPEDIFQIPIKIIDLVPEYKFYIRHYSTNNWETVLYAYI